MTPQSERLEMKKATLGQIQKILTLLEPFTSEQVQEFLGSGLLTEILRKGDVLSSIKEEMDLQHFDANCEMVMKLVAPEDIIVTRPRSACTYYQDSRNGKYQMKFWIKRYGYIKRQGHVSESRAGCKDCLLFEFYSSEKQPDHLEYPMESGDLSYMAPVGYKWYKEAVTVDRSPEVTIDVFRMKKTS